MTSPDAPRNPYAPPRAALDGERVVLTSTPAGRGARFFAHVTDGILTLPVRLIMFMTVSASAFQPDAAGDWGAALANLVMYYVWFLLLNGWLLARKGQTLGKMVMGLRIVDGAGVRASFSRIFWLRELLPMVLYTLPVVGGLLWLADALCIFRRDRRCLHDMLAGTLVHEVPPEPTPTPE